MNLLIPEFAEIVTQHERNSFSCVTFAPRPGCNIERVAKRAVSRVAGMRDNRPDPFTRFAFDKPLENVVFKLFLRLFFDLDLEGR